MKGNLITGVGYFFRGLSMLTDKGIRPFVIFPLLANILLFGMFWAIVWSYFQSLVVATEAALPGWLTFLTWLITPLLWLTGGLAAGYGSTLLVLLITSPFHTLLAEKIEERITEERIPRPEVKGIGPTLLEIPRSIARELSKLFYYTPIMLTVLVLSLIPGLQATAPLLWFLLGAWMMSLQFLDYPMDNHRLPFREVREACAARRFSSLGFGSTVALMASIPIVNLIIIPAAVIGATLMWCEELRENNL